MKQTTQSRHQHFFPGKPVVNHFGLTLGFFPGIGKFTEYVATHILGKRVGTPKNHRKHLNRQGQQQTDAQQVIHNQPDNSITSDKGILHDTECTLPVISAPETVEEIGQSVFV